MLPTIHGTGRLLEDADLRYTASGTAVVKIRLAFNSRKKDPQTGEWRDDASCFITGTAFGPAAENIAGSVERGMEVVVSGRLKTEQWETKEGEKRSALSLLIDAVGPSLRNATARVEKTGSQGGGREAFDRARQQAQGDPWGGQAQQPQQASGGWGQGGGYDDGAPF